MQNKWLRYGLLVLGGLLALCVVFGVGIFVGRSSVRFERRAVSVFRTSPSFFGAHGAVGTIQSIEGHTIMIQMRDGTIQTALVDQDTRIERNRQRITQADLKTGERVVVIGSPNEQRQLVAKWIHVFGSAPQSSSLQRLPPLYQFAESCDRFLEGDVL